ncbi:hypothetical protein E4U38_001211 [Claviceps purpurea]|nr:hypothetical protein E4U28_005832 [Claviceps purpurea]KAG6136849.1 hypothetical protein E4U38_001211 [Claviceps purpurea]KAG6228541.1 hypothetical protein E4U26_000930 [Claviceps purpurea]KAG6270726.1 hypothetical protein E4U49_005158 [Claviceps purpurea]KAG6307897.1 hypothetical protein E4U45_003203 [Claviceps purpurea]
MELASQNLDNDTRGWVMCVVSGIACVFGASIICVDFIVRLFPGKHTFRIQESNFFLASSLSLSFGVMMFSALYSMLPESKGYLEKDGWDDQPAGLLIMGCFIGGFVGIQAVSRLLHRLMPSHVVDCDHTHGDEPPTQDNHHSCNHARGQSRVSRARTRWSRPPPTNGHVSASKLDTEYVGGQDDSDAAATESTLLLPRPTLESEPEPNGARKPPAIRSASAMVGSGMLQRPTSPTRPSHHRSATDAQVVPRRPSSMFDVRRLMSFVKDTKCNCDEEGPCYGYTDPCGQECFKHLSTRSSQRPSQSASRQPTTIRTSTGPLHPRAWSIFNGAGHEDAPDGEQPVSPCYRTSRVASREPQLFPAHEAPQEVPDGASDAGDSNHPSARASTHNNADLESQQHHHHVPENAFLSIGLQTSIAIALHKFPEGFITYATNHANPALGFNVFMALFVHNISEGFAMCLPLYMALGSRWRAITWSAILGGLSQPIGAGMAAVWFKVAQRSNMAPNAVVYACLFAVTSGIMVSVGLQLFVEGLSLNHNRNLCIFFGFLGMAVLGLSNALFAAHDPH